MVEKVILRRNLLLENPARRNLSKEPNADEGSKEKPARKPRSKKADGDSQTKLAKGQVTKPSSTSVSDKVDKAAKPNKQGSTATESLDPFADSAGLELVEAVQRRMDWTPPMPTKTADVTPVTGGQLDNGLTFGGSVQQVKEARPLQIYLEVLDFRSLIILMLGRSPWRSRSLGREN
jgi:hypothetical protein